MMNTNLNLPPGRPTHLIFQKNRLEVAFVSTQIGESGNVWSFQDDPDPIFFEDQEFKTKVEEFFNGGYNNRKNLRSFTFADNCHTKLNTPYKADADDLKIWRSGANHGQGERDALLCLMGK